MLLCAALAMLGGINMDMHGTTSLGNVLVGLPMQTAYRTLEFRCRRRTALLTHLFVQCHHFWPLGMLLDAHGILTFMRDISLLLHLSLQAK